MKCPHCDAEIGFQKVCPSCGKEISYGGNTTFYSSAQKGTLTFKEIFADVFKKHERGDAMRSLSRTPNTAIDMLQTWRKPWMFLRLLVFMLVFFAALHYEVFMMNFDTLVTFYVVVGTMIGPLTMVLFLWEMDIHGNVNILEELLLLFVGGVAACILALKLFGLDLFPAGANDAPFIEEPAKLIICVIFILISKRKF